jgi:D-aminoacyl-tRNA deacylase
MRAVIQRVSQASVTVDGVIITSINNGLLVLLGIEETDDIDDLKWLSQKIVQLRIFNDDESLMNLSVKDINGEILLISQFTLFASTKKGNRPSFIQAAKPILAQPLYEQMIQTLAFDLGSKIETGIFGADMKVNLCNDGPVTICMDSKNKA